MIREHLLHRKEIIYAFIFQLPLHLIVKSKTCAKWVQIKWAGLRSNALHLSLVCPLPSHLLPHRVTAGPPRQACWALPVRRSQKFSWAVLGSGAESLPASPALLNSPPAKTAEEWEGENDTKPRVADPWFHTQFTESWVRGAGQRVNSPLPQWAPVWACMQFYHYSAWGRTAGKEEILFKWEQSRPLETKRIAVPNRYMLAL